MIEIKAAELEKANVCADGIALFRRYAGEVYSAPDYSLEDQLAVIRGPFRLYWGWAVTHGYLPAWSMAGADLCGADLRGANLRDADLRGADLCGADLRDADLRDADLCDADLRGADLRDADLCDADLRGIIGFAGDNRKKKK